MVTPDGKYLFFTSDRRTLGMHSQTPLTYTRLLDFLRRPGNGRGDIYWMDAAIIERIKYRTD
jgi:hypothetical protein